MSEIIDIIKNEININNSQLGYLQLQNHIYGCFVLIEDIAEKAIDVSGTAIINNSVQIIDFDIEFNKIGLHYGFIADPLLEYNSSDTYKKFWIEQFQSADLLQNIEDIDVIEDIIFKIINEHISSDNNFFCNALTSGSLSENFLTKVLHIIQNKKNDDIKLKEQLNVQKEKKEQEMQGGQKEQDGQKNFVEESVKKYVYKKNRSHKTRRSFVRRSTPIYKKRYYNKTRKQIQCVKNY